MDKTRLYTSRRNDAERTVIALNEQWHFWTARLIANTRLVRSNWKSLTATCRSAGERLTSSGKDERKAFDWNLSNCSFRETLFIGWSEAFSLRSRLKVQKLKAYLCRTQITDGKMICNFGFNLCSIRGLLTFLLFSSCLDTARADSSDSFHFQPKVCLSCFLKTGFWKQFSENNLSVSKSFKPTRSKPWQKEFLLNSYDLPAARGHAFKTVFFPDSNKY